MFPLNELQDLLKMLRERKFRRKAALKAIGAIYLFGVEQLPDDEPDPIPVTDVPVPARAEYVGECEGQLAAMEQDLTRLEHTYTQVEAGNMQRAAMNTFDWRGLLKKFTDFLPLIIQLLG